MKLAVRPAGALGGKITMPGDKSIAHRWLILAATAVGPSDIAGLPTGDDVRSTAACLARLTGERSIEEWLLGKRRRRLRIHGHGFDGLRQPPVPLDCGNSGTTMRLLAGLLAARPFSCVLDGDDGLLLRPMGRVAEPLRRMGGDVRTEEGHGPLKIRGASLRGIAHHLPVPSAQVKGALLLAGIQARGRTEVHLPGPSRDHTERALAAFGARVETEGNAVSVEGPFQHAGLDGAVPGDVSSAAFVLAAAAIRPGSEVTVEGVGVNPTRTRFLDVLRRAGSQVRVEPSGEQAGEPVGAVTLGHGELRAFSVRAEELPAVIDEIPALAAVAAHAPGESRFEGAEELRVKESDRLRALATGLRALGARAEVQGDGLAINGGELAGGQANGARDHRIVMALAVAAAGAREPSTIEGAGWAAISFPRFAESMRSLGAAIEEVE